jgi:bacillithiol synthase
LQDGPLERILAGLAQALPGGYAGPQILEMVRESAFAATTYGDWFCRLIAGLLGPLGLPVLDPMAPAARALAAPGVRRILACGHDVERALGAGVTRIEAAGLAPQVQPAPGETNLFFYPQGPTGPRQALVYTEAGRLQPRGSTGGNDSGWDVDHFLRLAGERPELFSGNVVTRPMLQDEMLPTLAYVAGPGEIAYYAQLKELYHALGRTMPLIWPRPSLTLVEPAVGRLLGRHGLSLAELPAGLDDRRNSLLRAADEAGVERLVEAMRRSVDEAYQPVVPALAAFDAVLGDLAAKNRRRVLDETGWLAKKARQVLTQRCRTGLGQLERVRSALWPRGGPQERMANIMYYLARYGPGLIEELAQLPVGPPFEHHYALIG